MTPALLTAVDSDEHVHLILGSGPLASARCTKSLQVGAFPILIAPEDATLHYGLEKSVESGRLTCLRRPFQDSDLTTLGRDEVDKVVDGVFITSGGKLKEATRISSLCRRLRIPINVTDAPNLCTFTLLSTHTDGPIQVGVTTSGKGCKLASRIRREIASSLPQDLGSAVDRLGNLRSRIIAEDHALGLAEEVEEDDESGQSATFNRLILPSDIEAARSRRMRWLAQICEYWPLKRLAAITDADVSNILEAYVAEANARGPAASILSPSAIDARSSRGRVVLAGSGPGHPDLLTNLTLRAIRSADLVLADKLVPSGVLDLIPRRVPVHIARKFPGNADAAQEELLSLGLAAARRGQTVLRLKQGDPYLYGRGAEEAAFFAAHDVPVTVLPGVTSALSAPLFAGIPVTHRAVADQVLVCTGTGRKGAAPDPPTYIPSQTVVFLMALHRLDDLVASLVQGKQWPETVPCAVVERASCPDQRVIRSTLRHVCAAVKEEGSRPPGLLVVGEACRVLARWEQRWVVEDGFAGFDVGESPVLEEVKLDVQGM